MRNNIIIERLENKKAELFALKFEFYFILLTIAFSHLGLRQESEKY